MMMGRSVNFIDAEMVSATDRGFTYGDGLFETVRVHHGNASLWHRHLSRLHDGCARLHLAHPDEKRLHAEVMRLCDGLDDAVVRITLSRGPGERGYALPAEPRQTIVVASSPLVLDRAAYEQGIAIRLCDTRYGDQPLLAGMKHLNRLEQVLARAEWSDTSRSEGLMRDLSGNVISATAANLFVVLDGRFVTPPVDRCGVAGVARAEVMACRQVRVEAVSLEQLVKADEVFLTSAVRGILPVRAFAGRTWSPGPLTRALQTHWRGLGLSLPWNEGSDT